MRRHAGIITIVAMGIASAALAGSLWARQAGQSAPAKPAGQKAPLTPAELAQEPAGKVFKNIKVLQDVPAYKLLDGMNYITDALGVRCEFCHNTRDFASDQKRTKRIARHMMQMLFAINKDNFNGRPAVSCYTCHQGHHHPIGAPLPMETAAPAAPAAPAPLMPRAEPFEPPAGTAIPTLDQILAKYTDALGGQQALAAVRTRVLEIQRSDGRESEHPMTQTVYEKSPNQSLILGHFRQFTFRVGYNGKEAWEGSPRGARILHGMDALMASREAVLNPVAALDSYTGKRLVAMAKIGDQETYVVNGLAPDGLEERFFFDTQSGLLLRRTIVYRTIFGPLLFQADYSDYQKEDGVAIPFKTQWWGGAHGWTDTVESVKANVPIEDSQFEPPPPGPRPGAPR
jgi:hypothetical protein